jgi:ABC-type Mn2+/Zn2+ transport system ATPase subunit
VLVDDLVVSFDDVIAVGGVSFAVQAGEAFGLLGPNGAGKTTTVRVLSTLLPATSGRAIVGGFDVRRNSLEVRASIGYIPQALSADGALTAREPRVLRPGHGRAAGPTRRADRRRGAGDGDRRLAGPAGADAVRRDVEAA